MVSVDQVQAALVSSADWWRKLMVGDEPAGVVKRRDQAGRWTDPARSPRRAVRRSTDADEHQLYPGRAGRPRRSSRSRAGKRHGLRATTGRCCAAMTLRRATWTSIATGAAQRLATARHDERPCAQQISDGGGRDQVDEDHHASPRSRHVQRRRDQSIDVLASVSVLIGSLFVPHRINTTRQRDVIAPQQPHRCHRSPSTSLSGPVRDYHGIHHTRILSTPPTAAGRMDESSASAAGWLIQWCSSTRHHPRRRRPTCTRHSTAVRERWGSTTNTT